MISKKRGGEYDFSSVVDPELLSGSGSRSGIIVPDPAWETYRLTCTLNVLKFCVSPPHPPSGRSFGYEGRDRNSPASNFIRRSGEVSDSTTIFSRLLQRILFLLFFWVQPRDGWVRKIPASQTQLRGSPTQLTPPLITFDGQSDWPFLRIHRLRAGGSLHVAGNTSSHNNVAICNLTVDY